MKKLIPLLILGMMLLNACSTNRSSEAAGKINGTPISLEQFYGSQRRNYADFSYRYGKNPDTTERRKIFNDTWRSLTQYTILKDYFEKYDIKVSDQEAIDT
ncbi:MAG: SurA N-terminal domain-containing protein, partial [Candidatus Cloacimonetes bacterium]|nr:SurA N-terminal domain-containing protein [Candidatus Cloacimonadota bacterium]